MTAEALPHTEFESAHRNTTALLEAEQFEAGLAAAQQWLDRMPLEPDEALRALQLRLLMARVVALIKLDRFDQVLQDCARMLDLVSVDQASAERAGVMIQLSFAQANLLMPENALRAAHVALQDGLQLRSSLLTAQALERLAMAYLSMGDGGAALSFMFQALEHMDQSNSGYERLRRYSNALHLICSLFDAYTDAGQCSEAAAVRERAVVFNQQASALAPQVSSHYIVSMWQANLARWQRRCGLAELARAAFVELEQRAAAAGWHAVRRPVQLELALMEEEQGRPQQALSLLAAVFEPADLRVRDVVALPSLRAQMRCFAATGQAALAALAAEQWAARQALRRQAEGRARAQLPGLDQRILAGLAAAERARLDEVVRLLRAQRQRGAGLKLLDHDWSDPIA